MTHMEDETPLKRAIAAIGGTRALADALGITPEAIYLWKEVPVLRVLEVERLTGVRREELRPDIYPRDEAAA